MCLNAGGMGRQDAESETLIPTTGGVFDVAHTLRSESFDASTDGSGRGTPIVPVAGTMISMKDSGGWSNSVDHAAAGYMVPEVMTLAIRGRGDRPNLEYRQDGTSNAVLTPNGGRGGIGVGAIAFPERMSGTQVAAAKNVSPSIGAANPTAVVFDTTQITSPSNYSNPQSGDPCHPLAAGAHPPAIATQWAVRRLTPLECERLQGFEDGYTDVPLHGKNYTPDSRRYKQLGNSMAVNVMSWIGQRIALFSAPPHPHRKG
jgi:DNA (cytosine-5)-methyltransferase 1